MTDHGNRGDIELPSPNMYTKTQLQALPFTDIRSPRPDDIKGIVDVVRTCEPYLTTHSSYIYWMNIRYSDTCAVAERSGEIVGFCSIIPTSGSKHFLHQLGVTRAARRHGIAKSLLTYLLEKLKDQQDIFALEFTVDRRNTAVLKLNELIAERMGMRIEKKGDVLPLLEPSEEELYIMIPRVTQARVLTTRDHHLRGGLLDD